MCMVYKTQVFIVMEHDDYHAISSCSLLILDVFQDVDDHTRWKHNNKWTMTTSDIYYDTMFICDGNKHLHSVVDVDISIGWDTNQALVFYLSNQTVKI